MFKETMMPKPEKSEEKNEKNRTENNTEKSTEEKIEEIKAIASVIKGIYNSIPDKSVLSKYYKSPVYFYHSLYFIGFKAGLIESSDIDKSEIGENKMTEILDNIESSAIKAFEGKDGIQDYIITMAELNAVRNGLQIISRVENKAEIKYDLHKIPEEIRPAIFPCLYDKESYFLESNKNDNGIVTVKMRQIDKDGSEEIREYSFKKDEEKWIFA